ncbi:hypothetical protein PFISCL1PPCAC_26368, partial [Pristionchus fissidentatus]
MRLRFNRKSPTPISLDQVSTSNRRINRLRKLVDYNVISYFANLYAIIESEYMGVDIHIIRTERLPCSWKYNSADNKLEQVNDKVRPLIIRDR